MISKRQLMVQLALIIDFPYGLTVHCACVVVSVGLTTSCEISDVIAYFDTTRSTAQFLVRDACVFFRCWHDSASITDENFQTSLHYIINLLNGRQWGSKTFRSFKNKEGRWGF